MAKAKRCDNDFGYRCPLCKRSDSLEIEATVRVHLIKDGTEPSYLNNDTEWDGKSYAECTAAMGIDAWCPWSGTVKDLGGEQ